MKIKMIMKNRSHKQDINRPRWRQTPAYKI